MIDDGPRRRRKDRRVPGQMGMLRLPVMVRCLVNVEMHVAHRRRNGADLD